MAQLATSDSGDWRTTKRFYAKILDGLADTQFGPVYVGVWGLMAVAFFLFTCGIILIGYMDYVGFNFIRFLREFPVLAVNPPPPKYALTIAPLREGGYWQIATFFLTATIIAWTIRIWERAVANKLRPLVAVVWSSAVFLYSAIYIIHPIWMGTWNEAPGHGLKAILDWTNYFSIKYGNFYYNPFHMVSIFALLGSTVVLAMHGATILATLQYNTHTELAEIESSTEGTHRAQLLWRWVMGFNATAHSIHTWALVMASLVTVAGALGILTSGPLEPNWFLWACRAGIVPGAQQACLPLP